MIILNVSVCSSCDSSLADSPVIEMETVLGDCHNQGLPEERSQAPENIAKKQQQCSAKQKYRMYLRIVRGFFAVGQLAVRKNVRFG